MTPPIPRPGPTARIALAFIEIRVNDWASLVRWYVETLELEIVLEDNPHQFALLDAGPVRIALKGKGNGNGNGSGSGPLFPVRDAVRLVFEVADVDAERVRLAGRDVAVGALEESPEGYRAIRLHDPEGTPITLFCWRVNASE